MVSILCRIILIWWTQQNAKSFDSIAYTTIVPAQWHIHKKTHIHTYRFYTLREVLAIESLNVKYILMCWWEFFFRWILTGTEWKSHWNKKRKKKRERKSLVPKSVHTQNEKSFKIKSEEWNMGLDIKIIFWFQQNQQYQCFFSFTFHWNDSKWDTCTHVMLPTYYLNRIISWVSFHDKVAIIFLNNIPILRH